MPSQNRLLEMRQKRGFGAAELASDIGVSRQTIYAMEAGNYVPNTIVALRLARVLGCKVEELFFIEDEPPARPENLEATLIAGPHPCYEGQPVQLCRVNGALIAVAPDSLDWSLPPADGVLLSKPRGGKTGAVQVQPFSGNLDLSKRLLAAGCDPGISVLARHLRRGGVELVVLNRNSTLALDLLKQELVHIAGTHLSDREDVDGSNLGPIRRLFDRRSVVVIGFSNWEEGIVVARGNPKNIRSIADFARKGVRIVNREPGAAVRFLLDDELRKLGISPKAMQGYDSLARGHLPAAMQVMAGSADCCIATKAAARVFGLDFISLIRERYNLVLRKKHFDTPEVQALCDTLGRVQFRQELEALGGYDTSPAGEQIA
jgi:molybdate-binding protein/DNA-binding XRE family transcriptional regulator